MDSRKEMALKAYTAACEIAKSCGLRPDAYISGFSYTELEEAAAKLGSNVVTLYGGSPAEARSVSHGRLTLIGRPDRSNDD